MSVQDIKNLFADSPIIAAVPQSRIELAAKSHCPVIFVLRSNVLTLKRYIGLAHEAGKKVFVHIDLCEGLGKDKSGVELLKIFGADGILSTHAQLIKEAKSKGLCTVQRFFALDSKGIGDMAEQISNSSPNFVEIMPGIATKIITKFANGNISVIAGGLIETPDEVKAALEGGAVAVSTGKSELWENYD